MKKQRSEKRQLTAQEKTRQELEDKHDVRIHIGPIKIGDSRSYRSTVTFNTKLHPRCPEKLVKGTFPTYEEALDAGINDVLDNIPTP